MYNSSKESMPHPLPPTHKSQKSKANLLFGKTELCKRYILPFRQYMNTSTYKHVHLTLNTVLPPHSSFCLYNVHGNYSTQMNIGRCRPSIAEADDSHGVHMV